MVALVVDSRARGVAMYWDKFLFAWCRKDDIPQTTHPGATPDTEHAP